MPRILFISTHNLATNPRLVKEIRLALENKFLVSVICFEFENWSKENNRDLIEEFHTVDFYIIPAGKAKFLPWLKSVFLEKTARLLGKLFPIKNSLLANAVSRRNTLLVKEIKKIKQADWVIGHNPGALYATHRASQLLNAKAGFDVEDYHPGEGNNAYLQKLVKKLMINLLPEFNYVSFAAPLIMERIKGDVKTDYKKWVTVLNLFPENEFFEPQEEKNTKLKLVWFSQHISNDRGLEHFLPGLQSRADEIEIHLIGNLNLEFYNTYLKDFQNIFIIKPLSQKELHKKLADFDIGLALDVPVDENRDLALTNKFFAYLQSGLFLLATNTRAHVDYLNKFPNHGYCFDYKSENRVLLNKVFENLNNIKNQKMRRFDSFRKKGFENESNQLLVRWEL